MLGRLLLATCAAAFIPVSAASAATEIGQTAVGTVACGDGNTLAWQLGASHAAPGKGVITQLRTSSGTAGALVSIKVVRPSTSTILFTTAPVTVASPGAIVSVDVRVPVEPGDTLGMWMGSDGNICALPVPSSLAGVIGSPDQPVGPVAGTIATSTGALLAVAARFEADADGDGFGDDTQDSCPTDSAISSGSCTADAVLSASATPASIRVGDVAVIEMSAAVAGASTVRGAALAAALPAGLERVMVTPKSCAFATAFSCSLPDFSGGSREAALVVRGKTPGSYGITVALTTTTADPNGANNAASVPLTVTPAGTCKVPALKRRTKAIAAALLKAAGCKLGATKTKRVRKGKARRVVAQSRKAGSSVPLGTKVGITLSRRARG